jgi:hypothetical protein
MWPQCGIARRRIVAKSEPIKARQHVISEKIALG